MDPIQPVGTLVNPPNLAQGFAPLSALLGVQRQQQQLQAGAAEVQQQQQTAQQRKAIAGIDWSKYDDGTGTISTDKMLADPDLRARSGDQFLTILQAGATARQTQIQNKQQLQNLRASSRVQFGSVIGRLANDEDVQKDSPEGRQKVAEAIKEFGDEGPDEANIARIYGGVVQHAPPGGLARGVRAIQLQAMDANGQITTTTPQPQATTNKAGQIQFVNTNANAPQGVGTPLGGPIDQGLGPEARATTIQLPNNQTAILDRASGQYRIVGGGGGGNGQGAAPQIRTAEQDAPGPNAPAYIQTNYSHNVQLANDHVTDIRTRDKDYGGNMAISGNIRSLLPTTTTGPTSQAWHSFFGAIGQPFGSNAQANYQTLNSWLDRQGAMLASQMGVPHTNQGADTAASMAGNVDMQRNAIAAKNDYNEALTQGLHDYRQGLDRVAGFGGNASPKAVNAFNAKWVNNFDPRGYEWKLAKARGDTDAMRRIEGSMSAAERKQLANKLRTIDALVAGQQ